MRGISDKIAEVQKKAQLLLSWSRFQKGVGCEGNLAATSVTPLVGRVDSADLAG